MKKIILRFIAAMTFFVWMSPFSFAQDTIILAGTGDGQKYFEILATAFEKANPGTQIKIPPSIDSSGGVRATAKGLCDLGRVARPIREKEKQYNLNHKPILHSPVVFAASRNVEKVDNITSEQLLDVLSGKVTDWRDLGGKNAKLYLIQREKGDAARIALVKGLPGFKKIEHLAGLVIYSTEETIESIANHNNTIGYISLAGAQNTDLKVFKIDGVYPSKENIQNGRYKIVMTLGFVWKGKLSGLAKKFFDFCFSLEGKKVIRENGAVPAF